MSDLKEKKNELLQMIKEKAFIRGERILASGKKANFYIDGKQLTLDPHGLYLFANVILDLIATEDVDAIGGPTLGADPIAAAVSALSSRTAKPIKAFIVRKEAKQHGMQKMIEGPELKAGQKVVMVEDVITTGGSVLKAIREVEQLGVKVIRTICLVDRAEGGKEILKDYNYTPLFELKDLGI